MKEEDEDFRDGLHEVQWKKIVTLGELDSTNPQNQKGNGV